MIDDYNDDRKNEYILQIVRGARERMRLERELRGWKIAAFLAWTVIAGIGFLILAERLTH